MTESLPRTQGLRPIGEIAAEVVEDLAYRRKVKRLHKLGARILAEYLAELGVERDIRTIIDRKLDVYGEIDPEALRATGCDRFPPVPIHVVPRT